MKNKKYFMLLLILSSNLLFAANNPNGNKQIDDKKADLIIQKLPKKNKIVFLEKLASFLTKIIKRYSISGQDLDFINIVVSKQPAGYFLNYNFKINNPEAFNKLNLNKFTYKDFKSALKFSKIFDVGIKFSFYDKQGNIVASKIITFPASYK